MTATVIAGLGGALPDNVVTNEDLARDMDTSDAWIRSRTGIAQRYWSRTSSTGDLAVEAGRQALQSAGDGEIDLLIVATTTPDFSCPATAPAVAARLDLGAVAAFDVAAVCSGFVYALAAAKGFLEAGMARSALVIGAETYSTILDPADRTTSVIFGDGAGAVVLRAADDDEPGAVGHVDLGSDGTQRDLIRVPGGGAYHRTHPGADDSPYFAMAGREVFRAAVTRMTESSRRALAESGWDAGEVDWVVGHQANTRILAAVADQLRLGHDRLVVNLDRVGNTSAASIPLALVHAATADLLRVGDKLLLTAFGGGTAWGSATVLWPDVKVVPAALVPT